MTTVISEEGAEELWASTQQGLSIPLSDRLLQARDGKSYQAVPIDDQGILPSNSLKDRSEL